jgi:hypothetical protein
MDRSQSRAQCDHRVLAARSRCARSRCSLLDPKLQRRSQVRVGRAPRVGPWIILHARRRHWSCIGLWPAVSWPAMARTRAEVMRNEISRNWKQLLRLPCTCFLLAIAFVGCADADGNGACAWLYAPPGFVDAGGSACKAEPAGPKCDPKTGECPLLCPPNEFLLTCRTADISPVETLEVPVATDEPSSACILQSRNDGGGEETTYCCHCGR